MICPIMPRAISSRSSFWISGDVYFSGSFRSHSMSFGFSWAHSFSSWWKLEFSSDFVSVFQSPLLNGKACSAKYRMLHRIESKIFLFLLFLMHVVQIAKQNMSLKFFGSYKLSDTFTKTWSGGLSFVFVVFSLPAFVLDSSKSFSFPSCSLIQIVSSTTPGSVSLLHGFTQDKSVPYLFSTPQTRSQQQTEVFVHLLKKLAPVNEISGVLSLVDPMWIFSPKNMGRTSILG